MHPYLVSPQGSRTRPTVLEIAEEAAVGAGVEHGVVNEGVGDQRLDGDLYGFVCGFACRVFGTQKLNENEENRVKWKEKGNQNQAAHTACRALPAGNMKAWQA